MWDVGSGENADLVQTILGLLLLLLRLFVLPQFLLLLLLLLFPLMPPLHGTLTAYRNRERVKLP